MTHIDKLKDKQTFICES